MDDLISRRAAIEALGEEPELWYGSDTEIAERTQWRADMVAIKTVEPASLYGYNINDLLVFADACRKAEITNDELKIFVQSTEQMLNIFGKKVESELAESLKRFFNNSIQWKGE